MKPINPDIVLKPVKEYVLMAVGMLMYSFGWIGCILPAGGVGGGAAGLSLVLCNALSTAGIDLQIGTMVFIINAVLLLVAGFIVGWNFGLKTIFCVVIISLGMNFWQEVLPDGNFLGVDNLLAIVMGGILAGAGIALCFSQGGSTGGTDIVARLLKLKFPWLPMGKLILIPDGVVLALTAIAFQRLETALYGAVALYVSSKVMDTVLYGMNASKVAYIISDDWKAVADAILAYDRGVTILNAAGAYTGAEKHVLLVAFRQREIVEIKRRVHAIDPGAFLIVCDAHEVLGEGFREYQKEEL